MKVANVKVPFTVSPPVRRPLSNVMFHFIVVYYKEDDLISSL